MVEKKVLIIGRRVARPSWCLLNRLIIILQNSAVLTNVKSQLLPKLLTVATCTVINNSNSRRIRIIILPSHFSLLTSHFEV